MLSYCSRQMGNLPFESEKRSPGGMRFRSWRRIRADLRISLWFVTSAVTCSERPCMASIWPINPSGCSEESECFSKEGD